VVCCGSMTRALWVLGGLWLLGCTCGEPSAPTEPGPGEAPTPSVEDVPPLPDAPHDVESLGVASVGRSEDGPRTVVALADRGAATGTRPQDAASLGVVFDHAGMGELHQVREVASPYATVTLIGRDQLCEVGVQRALDVWRSARDPYVTEEPEEPEADPDGLELDLEVVERAPTADRRQLALVLEAIPAACEASSAALAGAPVDRRAIEPGMLEPASAALVALVHRYERELGGTPSPGVLRALALGVPDAFVVSVPEMAYLVRGGRVLTTLDALPYAELRAGSRAFLLCSSVQDDYLAPLDALGRGAPAGPSAETR
jgi:hypothetical protein